MESSKLVGKKKKKNSWLKWIFLGVVLLVTAAFFSGIFDMGIEASKEEVIKGSVNKIVEETGTISVHEKSLILANGNFKILNINYKVGDEVEKDDVLIETDLKYNDLNLKSLQEELKSLNEQYKVTKTRMEQFRKLYNSGGISKNSYLDLKVETETLFYKIESLKLKIESLSNNKKTKSEDLKKQKGIEDVLKMENISSEVKSPIKGIITEVFISKGDDVLLGSKLIEVSNMSTAYLEVNLITDDVSKITLGDEVLLKNYPDIKGKVKKIHPKIKSEVSELGISRKRAIVEIEISEPQNFILGSDIEAKIIVDHKKDIKLVNKKSVLNIEKKDYVYLVNDSKVKLKEIQVGIEGEDYYEVIDGLDEGDEVVVHPNKKLKDGSKIKTEKK